MVVARINAMPSVVPQHEIEDHIRKEFGTHLTNWNARRRQKRQTPAHASTGPFVHCTILSAPARCRWAGMAVVGLGCRALLR
jgi:hypothetical protein